LASARIYNVIFIAAIVAGSVWLILRWVQKCAPLMAAMDFRKLRKAAQPGLFMNTCYVVRSSRPAGLFSFGLLDGLHVRLRRPYLREVPASFGLERLATVFMNNPG
jgi:hypothetical protein